MRAEYLVPSVCKVRSNRNDWISL